MGRTGVVLLGFGGPDSLDAVGPFMCNLMGREPSEELVERVCRRYLTIGGSSPIVGIASEIAAGLESRLVDAGHDFPVRVGMRYWDPFIEDALAELVDLGCDRVITVSLSPFESKVTSGAYREAVAETVAGLGDIEVIDAPLISEMPEFATFFAGAAAVALTDIAPNEGAIVVFTAHSLPESDLVGVRPLRRRSRAGGERGCHQPGPARGRTGWGERSSLVSRRSAQRANRGHGSSSSSRKVTDPVSGLARTWNP